VTAGVSPGDTIIVNPPDSLATGQSVKVAAPKAKNDAKDSDAGTRGGKGDSKP